MFSKATKPALLLATAFATALVAQAASATMVDTWDYTVLSGFTSYQSLNDTDGRHLIGSIDATGGGNNTQSYNGAATKLSWPHASGYSGVKSSISIDGNVSGSGLTTNGSSMAGATFEHSNNKISDAYNVLSTFNLVTSLSLKATAPPEEAGQKPSPAIPALTFNGHFSETPNSGTCAVGDGGPKCSDIFVLSNVGDLPGDVSQNGNAYVLSQDFQTGDGGLYTALLSIDGLGVLPEDVCHTAGADTGCIGLTTKEEQDNFFHTHIQVVSRSVPEPGTLAMLGVGLGLIGLGFAARRRRNGLQS